MSIHNMSGFSIICFHFFDQKARFLVRIEDGAICSVDEKSVTKDLKVLLESLEQRIEDAKFTLRIYKDACAISRMVGIGPFDPGHTILESTETHFKEVKKYIQEVQFMIRYAEVFDKSLAETETKRPNPDDYGSFAEYLTACLASMTEDLSPATAKSDQEEGLPGNLKIVLKTFKNLEELQDFEKELVQGLGLFSMSKAPNVH